MQSVPLGFSRATQSLILTHPLDASFASQQDKPVAVNPQSTANKTLRYEQMPFQSL